MQFGKLAAGPWAFLASRKSALAAAILIAAATPFRPAIAAVIVATIMAVRAAPTFTLATFVAATS